MESRKDSIHKIRLTRGRMSMNKKKRVFEKARPSSNKKS